VTPSKLSQSFFCPGPELYFCVSHVEATEKETGSGSGRKRETADAHESEAGRRGETMRWGCFFCQKKKKNETRFSLSPCLNLFLSLWANVCLCIRPSVLFTPAECLNVKWNHCGMSYKSISVEKNPRMCTFFLGHNGNGDDLSHTISLYTPKCYTAF